jgi:hypothetical protein
VDGGRRAERQGLSLSRRPALPRSTAQRGSWRGRSYGCSQCRFPVSSSVKSMAYLPRITGPRFEDSQPLMLCVSTRMCPRSVPAPAISIRSSLKH